MTRAALNWSSPRILWLLGSILCLWLDSRLCPATEALSSKFAAVDDATFEDILTLAQKATAFQKSGDDKKAIPIFEEALAKSTKAVGDDDPFVATLQRALGATYQSQADYPKALRLYESSLATREKVYGPNHPEVANSLNSLASFYRERGDTAKASSLYERSLMIVENYFGPEKPEVAYTMDGLAQTVQAQGDFRRALPLFERSLRILEKEFGPDDPRVAIELNNLGEFYRHLGSFEKALPLYERCLAISKKTFGPDHPDVATALNNLALLYSKRGNYAEAMRLFRQSLEIRESKLGTGHPDYAASLGNVARLYRELGDIPQALSMHKRSLAVMENFFPSDHPNVAQCLMDLGTTTHYAGGKTEALGLFRRALAMRERLFGQDHPDVADSLDTLGFCIIAMGQYTEALLLLERSLAIRQKCFGAEHSRVAETLCGLAMVYHEQHNFSKATAFYQRGLVIAEKMQGTNSPTATAILGNIAVLAVENGDIERGGALFDECFRRWRNRQATELSSLPEKYAYLSVADNFDEISRLHSVGASGRGSILVGANQVALGKAFLEEVQAAANAKGYQKQAVANAEQNLTKHTPLVAQTIRERTLTLTDIAQSLPPQSALVDFIQYQRYDFAAKTNHWQEQRYAAYLTFPLAHDSTNVVVKRVDLGEAAPINGAVAEWFQLLADKRIDPKRIDPVWQRLSQLVYAPLAPHLTNVSHLIVCPDGQLSRLPFEMLPVENKFLLEEKTISYVTSGREVVRLANQTNSKRETRNAKSLVMGNPDFNLDLSARSRRREEAEISRSPNQPVNPDGIRLLTSAATRALSRDYRGLKFTPLPGSGVEATNVAKLLGGDAVLLLGQDAREAELKAVVSPRVLHLATHGFFLSDQEFKRTNSSVGSFAFARPGLPEGRTSKDWENPMVRCGIALAGANHAKPLSGRAGSPLPAASSSTTNGAHGVTRPTFEAEDGLLTGLEAALLNLQGTELVILSACDSGTGEVKIGEGVMSLRRAFRIAGAESVLASHWPVSDKATSKLMTEFMRRWRAGEPRAKAWREAQLELLRSKGTKEDFSNPFFWAAFTLTGQWN